MVQMSLTKHMYYGIIILCINQWSVMVYDKQW